METFLYEIHASIFSFVIKFSNYTSNTKYKRHQSINTKHKVQSRKYKLYIEVHRQGNQKRKAQGSHQTSKGTIIKNHFFKAI